MISMFHQGHLPIGLKPFCRVAACKPAQVEPLYATPERVLMSGSCYSTHVYTLAAGC